jgi:hypothetical protein
MKNRVPMLHLMDVRHLKQDPAAEYCLHRKR